MADPTNDTPEMPGWSQIASTTSRLPLTRLMTPGGSSSSSWISSKIASWASGTCSDGLSTNVLPQATANGRNHMGTMAGKLNGQMAPNTPIGCR